ncbi:RuvC family protein [Enemella dayhoffiae]|uniref:crossover junction endodeoxyribonuclease RuvC n=1 Tax=Enemella dayhoffiae TaxID=2016507 RepID=UPI0011403C5A|nr:crossover junction endodeoxyribonuclease RuvC [Enemella dayhoffiae]
MSATVIGIDPSLTATGICTTAGDLITLRSTPTAGGLPEELARIEALTGRILAHADGADVAVIEAPSFGQSRQGGEHIRAGLWWMIVAALTHADISTVRVPPAALKKFATGRGNATKPDMRMALYQRASIDCRDDNQVDAFWLRQIGLHHLDHPDAIRLPATHLVGLAKVDWPIPDACPF